MSHRYYTIAVELCIFAPTSASDSELRVFFRYASIFTYFGFKVRLECLHIVIYMMTGLQLYRDMHLYCYGYDRNNIAVDYTKYLAHGMVWLMSNLYHVCTVVRIWIVSQQQQMTVIKM